ncbi:MAG TPA: SHOCT domain-containing protein [Burkholderiaceae bacterium]
MNWLTRSAWIAVLSLALSPAFAQADLGGAPRGQPVQVLRDSAAGRVVATVYEGSFSWVRIETRENGAALNQHPFEVAPATLRTMLERLQLVNAKAEPLFSAKQLDEITAPLATALGRANAEQDVSFAVSDRFGLFGPLAPRSVTTARVFHRDGQLQVITGLVRRDFESQFRGSGLLIAFEPGQRAQPVERGTKLAVAPGGGSQARDDWIALSTSTVAAAPAAAATPAAATPAVAPTAAAVGSGAASAAKPSAPTAAPAPVAKDADELYRSTAERLRALEKLRKDGLVSEAEYQEKRQRILREL